MEIRKAGINDKEAIWKVHSDAIRNVCNSHYDKKQVQTWAGKINPESYTQSIKEREMFVAEVDGTVAGFGQLNLATGEIEAVYVMSAQINKGVGQQLFNRLEAAAKDNRLKNLCLSSSLNAVDFYKRLGFVSLDETTHRITSDTVLPCVRMEKKIKEEVS